MILDDVHRGIQKNKKRKRIGRGPGSGHGKTSGRGHKGYYSRSGSSRRLSYEGGQMPLARRIAKRGFNNRAFADKVVIFNLYQLEKAFSDGETVTAETLIEKGLLKGRFDVVKILSVGDLTRKLTVKVDRLSTAAAEKIKSAGGSIEVLEQPAES